MEKTIIDIGTKINLQDLVQSRLLIQANSGGGKTVICRTLIEESHGKIPFIIIDDAGEFSHLTIKNGNYIPIDPEECGVGKNNVSACRRADNSIPSAG